jgi:hypothetical protein
MNRLIAVVVALGIGIGSIGGRTLTLRDSEGAPVWDR